MDCNERTGHDQGLPAVAPGPPSDLLHLTDSTPRCRKVEAWLRDPLNHRLVCVYKQA